jgi:hypothetical protein
MAAMVAAAPKSMLRRVVYIESLSDRPVAPPACALTVKLRGICRAV